MNFDKIMNELHQLVRKPPEDVTAKMQLHYLAVKVEKSGLSDKQSESDFLQQLKMISRMTIDKEIFRTLENMIFLIQINGIKE